MKAKLVIEGREFPIEINDPELQKILMPKKKTGYDRVEYGAWYYYDNTGGEVDSVKEEGLCTDNESYEVANYYSDKTVAQNNARADKLMRQLRRFAVEHRENELQWKINGQNKYIIYYNYTSDDIQVYYGINSQYLGCVYFDSQETAREAIKTFYDELIWYFTEYKDSL